MFYFSSAIAHTENVAFEWNRMGGEGKDDGSLSFNGWLVAFRKIHERSR